jgi:glutathione S-transferase
MCPIGTWEDLTARNQWRHVLILIGQYDSPFVRRVGIALRLYQMPFEHRPWSVFGDAERIASYNPLMRVPTLALDNGEVLIESAAILDHLDELASDAALIPRAGALRARSLKVCALATGLAEKAVALFYERAFHQRVSDRWGQRCTSQIHGVLDVLEAQCAGKSARYWFGETLGHPDIAVACAVRFSKEAHPMLFSKERWPALSAHASYCESLEPFLEISQAFNAPSS